MIIIEFFNNDNIFGLIPKCPIFLSVNNKFLNYLEKKGLNINKVFFY